RSRPGVRVRGGGLGRAVPRGHDGGGGRAVPPDLRGPGRRRRAPRVRAGRRREGAELPDDRGRGRARTGARRVAGAGRGEDPRLPRVLRPRPAVRLREPPRPRDAAGGRAAPLRGGGDPGGEGRGEDGSLGPGRRPSRGGLHRGLTWPAPGAGRRRSRLARRARAVLGVGALTARAGYGAGRNIRPAGGTVVSILDSTGRDCLCCSQVTSVSTKARLADQQPFDVTGCSGNDLTTQLPLRGKHGHRVGHRRAEPPGAARSTTGAGRPPVLTGTRGEQHDMNPVPHRRRSLTVAAAAAAAGLLLTACGGGSGAPDGDGSPSPSGEPVAGGDLTCAITVDSHCVDPQQVGNNDAIAAARQTVASLTAQDPRTGEIVPWIAESWEVNDDASSYTFHLRDDATYADGTPIDAESVKTNLDAIVALGAAASLGSQYLVGYEGTTVVDPQTVTVDFAAPSAQFLQATSTFSLGLLAPSSAELSVEDRCAGK